MRFTTATALINELAEAAHANQLSRALGRWERLDLICIDELGYVPLAETASELMFQVIADRAEKAAVIVTTNLPFSEWSHSWRRAVGDQPRAVVVGQLQVALGALADDTQQLVARSTAPIPAWRLR